EDGIRDLYVTGVQTCALPIWRAGGHRGAEHVAGGELRVAEALYDPLGLRPLPRTGRPEQNDTHGVVLVRPTLSVGTSRGGEASQIGRASCRERGSISVHVVAG